MAIDPKIADRKRQLDREIRESKSNTDVVRTTYSLSESVREAVHMLAFKHRVKNNDIINVAVEDFLLRLRIQIELTRPGLRARLQNRRRGEPEK
jgi:predicted solute-binding protein